MEEEEEGEAAAWDHTRLCVGPPCASYGWLVEAELEGLHRLPAGESFLPTFGL